MACSCDVMLMIVSSEATQRDRDRRDVVRDVLLDDQVHVRDATLRDEHDVIRLERHVLCIVLTGERPLEEEAIAFVPFARAADQDGVLEARGVGEPSNALDGLEGGHPLDVLERCRLAHLAPDEYLAPELADDDHNARIFELPRIGAAQVVGELVCASPAACTSPTRSSDILPSLRTGTFSMFSSGVL